MYAKINIKWEVKVPQSTLTVQHSNNVGSHFYIGPVSGGSATFPCLSPEKEEEEAEDAEEAEEEALNERGKH